MPSAPTLARCSQPDVLVVSGFSEDGRPDGGVFVLGPQGFSRLDARPTAGLAFDPATGTWLRALSHRHAGGLRGEVLEVGAGPAGTVERELGVVRDAHDVLRVGGEPLVVSTHDNAVFALGAAGPKVRVRLPGEPDSWHLNCLEVIDDELYASAFGRGGSYRSWSSAKGGGLVLSLGRGTAVVEGLSTPHSPRFSEGCWLVCNSGAHELVAVDPAQPGRVVRSVDVGGFSRGLAVGRDAIFVGVSARRHAEGADASAYVAVVDPDAWRVLERIPVPCPELYECRLVPSQAAVLLATALPGGEADGRPASGDVEAASSTDRSGLSLRAELPERLDAGDLVYLDCRLLHPGPVAIDTRGEHPLQASYRFIGRDGSRPVAPGTDEPLRTRLPELLPAAGSVPVELVVRVPAVPGRYLFRLALVEEGLRWRDELEPDAFSAREVAVT